MQDRQKRQLFKISRLGTVGLHVIEGKITKRQTSVIRDGVVVHEGKIATGDV